LLHAVEYKPWYTLIPHWYWFRIYSFNADDVLELAYAGGGAASLDAIVPPETYLERDAFLHSVQYIRMHGSIRSQKELTFGPQEYGSRAAKVDVWHQHFAGDYATRPAVIVGAELDDPTLWQYLKLRGEQQRTPVRRPKCFLVAPRISKPQEQVLEQLNVVSVRASGEEFFEWLHRVSPPLSRENVLRQVDPTLEPALEQSATGTPSPLVALTEYFCSLFKIPPTISKPKRSPGFLLGSPPRWEDLAANLDAPRDITVELLETLRAEMKVRTVEATVLTSAAGGGKSTTLRRAALQLSAEGHKVFFSDGEIRPDSDRIAAYLRLRDEVLILFFDNAGHDLSYIADLIKRTSEAKKAPIIAIACRSNDFAFGGLYLARYGRIKEMPVPLLSDADIIAVLGTLEHNNLLGYLRGKTPEQRVAIFKEKARKQILVAMREATSGRGFDDIIHDEFESITPDAAKELYLAIALASTDNYGLSIQQMILAMNDRPPTETMVLVEKSLSGILLQKEGDS
ncbi:MAG: SIR2 family protein, partial [Terriglobia bacterium]